MEGGLHERGEGGGWFGMGEVNIRDVLLQHFELTCPRDSFAAILCPPEDRAHTHISASR